MTYITSEVNNVGDTRLYAQQHDTGDIGVGTMKKNGKFSAQLWAPQDVLDFALDLIELAKMSGAVMPEPVE